MRMFKILGAIFVLAALAVFAMSCGGSSHAQVRVVHASPDAPNVDVEIGNTTVTTNLAFGSVWPSTHYSSVSSGSPTLQVFNTGTTTSPLISSALNLSGGTSYTIIAEDFLASIKALLLTDDNSAPSSGDFKLRVIHEAPTISNIDIYVVSPGTDISTVNANLSSLAFGTASSYLGSLAAGNWEVVVTPTGSKARIIDVNAYTFSAGQIRTLVILDEPGGGGVNPTPLELSDVN